MESQPSDELVTLRDAHQRLLDEHMRVRSELAAFRSDSERPLGLVYEPERESGTNIAIAVSIALHALLITWAVSRVTPVRTAAKTPIARYVELMRQQPFEEAPGKPVERAPLSALYSNANRRASIPEPTGEQPTLRPGDGSNYIPGSSAPRAESSRRIPSSGMGASTEAASPQDTDSTALTSPSKIDWSSAIREVGRVASLGGGGELGSIGGETGFAESGPVSFSSQWYDWGEYAEGMVRRIRVNWYDNMPQLIRTGMKGVVVIRFTIQRSGAITDVQIVSSSTVPPYDFAAKKAIELSTPLAPLPADFPNDSEVVTAQFFYNSSPARPSRR